MSITMSVSQAAAPVRNAAPGGEEEEVIDQHASIQVWQGIGQKLARAEIWALDEEDEFPEIEQWQGVGQKLARAEIWALEEIKARAWPFIPVEALSESDSICADDNSEWELESLMNTSCIKEGSVQGSTSAGEMSDSEASSLSALASPLQTPLQIPRIPDSLDLPDLPFEDELPDAIDALCLPSVKNPKVSQNSVDEEINVVAWQDLSQRLASADFWDSVSDSDVSSTDEIAEQDDC